MLSCKTLEAVELICRSVKGNNLTFGGIQVIAAGSFFQLPPVPSLTDEGLYAFQSENFRKIFPLHFKLESVLRQTEPDLIKAINELCDGMPSKETNLAYIFEQTCSCQSSNSCYVWNQLRCGYVQSQ